MEPFAGANALPSEVCIMDGLKAKAAIDNCRAGRTAKGATLGTCFLSPFFPDVLVVVVNAIRNPIVFRAKIGKIPPLSEKSHPKAQTFCRK